MSNARRHFSPEQKVNAVRRHLLEQVPVSQLCDELGSYHMGQDLGVIDRMRMGAALAKCALFASFVFLTPLRAIEPDADVETLRQAKVKDDNESLIAFLNQLTTGEEPLARRDEFIRQLGSPKFKEREDAIKALIDMRSAAAPALNKAAHTGDAETRRNARRCLDQIEMDGNSAAPLAAVRLLVRRRASRSTEVLLRYLPSAASYEVEEEICFGLDNLTEKAGRILPPIMAALTDPQPARRAIAACIVGNRGTPYERARARALLKDPEPSVRLRAAQGLLAGKEMDAIPALIALLDAAAVHEAWQAEELLRWAADGNGPDCFVANGGDSAKKCRAAWEQWWLQRKGNIDFSALTRQPRRPCLFAVWEPSMTGFGPVGIGCDGTQRWHLGAIGVKAVAQMLPNGRLLATGAPREIAARGANATYSMEVDWTGRVYWSYQVTWNDEMVLVERLPDRRTHFVMKLFGHGFVGPNGTLLVPPGQKYVLTPHTKPWQPREIPVPDKITLRNGHWLTLDTARGRFLEFDPTGRVVGETGCICPEGSKIQILFPLVRLGFGDMLGRDYDLTKSLSLRLEGLRNQDPGLRALALIAVRRDFDRKITEALPLLFEALGDHFASSRFHKNYALRQGFIDAIQAISADPINDAVRFADSTNDRARAAAVAISGMSEWKKHKEPERWAVVRKGLRDPSAAVRKTAAQAAGVFGDRHLEVVPLLIEALSDDTEPIPGEGCVGASAASSLVVFRGQARVAVPALKRAAYGKDSSRAVFAVQALGGIAISDPTSFSDAFAWFLAALKESSAQPAMRSVAAHFVARLEKDPSEAARKLAAVLSSKEPTPPVVKLGLIDSLRLLKNAAHPAIPALTAALDDPDPNVRKEARSVLATIREK